MGGLLFLADVEVGRGLAGLQTLLPLAHFEQRTEQRHFAQGAADPLAHQQRRGYGVGEIVGRGVLHSSGPPRVSRQSDGRRWICLPIPFHTRAWRGTRYPCRVPLLPLALLVTVICLRQGFRAVGRVPTILVGDGDQLIVDLFPRRRVLSGTLPRHPGVTLFVVPE